MLCIFLSTSLLGPYSGALIVVTNFLSSQSLSVHPSLQLVPATHFDDNLLHLTRMSVSHLHSVKVGLLKTKQIGASSIT